MSIGVTYKIDLFDNVSKTLGGITANMQKVGGSINNLNDRFSVLGNRLFLFNNIKDALTNLTSSLESSIAPGIALDTSLKDLSAISGLAGKELNKISDAARRTAQHFGIQASGAVESYKLILSQLGPEIAQNSQAMDAMGKHIATLSKTMGGDATAAASVLTTAMNQYSIDTTDASAAAKKMGEMMNVMAAAAKEGSAELPQINEALKQSGMVAASAGVSFEELNAAIQVLDKAGKKGAEGGVAIRNFISELGRGRFQVKETKDELARYGISVDTIADKNISLSQKIHLLQPIMHDSALVAKMFGRENAAAAIALLQGVDTLEDYTQKITGTNTAVEQASIIMNSYAEKTARANAWMDDFKIRLFNMTQSFMPYLSAVGKGIADIGTFSTGLLSSINIMRLIPFGSVINGFKLISLAALRLPVYAVRGFFNAFRMGAAAFVSNSAGMMQGFKRIHIATLFTSGLTTAWGFITQGVVKGMILPAIRSVGVAIMSIPILGWIAAAISGLIWLGKYLWDTSKKFREVIMGIWEVIKYVSGQIISVFSHAFGAIWNGLKAIGSGIKSVFSYLYNISVKVFSSLADIVKKAISWISDKMGVLFKPLIAIVEKLFGGDSKIGDAYRRGKEKGAASYDRDHAKEEQQAAPSILQGKSQPKLAQPLLANQVSSAKLSPSAPAEKGSSGGIKNISIKMTNLVGAINITQQSIQQSAEEMKRKVQAALIEAVNDAQLSM